MVRRGNPFLHSFVNLFLGLDIMNLYRWGSRPGNTSPKCYESLAFPLNARVALDVVCRFNFSSI